MPCLQNAPAYPFSRVANRVILPLLLAALFMPVQPAEAQIPSNPEITFAPPTTIAATSVPQRIRTPFAATDAHGAIYVVYTVQNGSGQSWNSDLWLARSTDDAATWTNQHVLNGQVRSPSLALGPGGQIYIAFLGGSQCYEVSPFRCDGSEPVFPAIELIKSADGGNTFSAPVLVSSSGMTAVYPGQVALDPQGKVYVLWSEGTLSSVSLNLGGPTLLQLAASADGVNFGPALTIAAGEMYPCGSLTCQEIFRDSHLAISNDGTMHALWTAYYHGQIRYARSSNGTSFPVSYVDAPLLGVPAGNPSLVGGPTGEAAFVFLIDTCAYSINPPCTTMLRTVRIDRVGAANSYDVIDPNEGEMDGAVSFDAAGAILLAYNQTSYSNPKGSFEFLARAPAHATANDLNSSLAFAPRSLVSTIPSAGFPGSADLAQESVTPDVSGNAVVAWVEAEENSSGFLSGYKLLARKQNICPDILGNGSGDADGDGLCDDWEINGIRDDLGNVLLDLPAMGANPNHKDVFVEVDYLDCAAGGTGSCSTPHSHKPDPNGLAMVIAAFAASPVQNPDGLTGINLHIDQSQEDALPHFDTIDFEGAFSQFNFLKLGPEFSLAQCNGGFGTSAERSAPDCAERLDARRKAFHYVIFAHDQQEDPDSSGESELPGNDTLVTLGGASDAFTDSVAVNCLAGENRRACGERNAEAGTLMHELGHALGLHHGGDDDLNCKPNYISVMTYSRQFPNYLPLRDLDYSRHEYLPVDENLPNESLGVIDSAAQHPDQPVIWGVNGTAVVRLANGPLDWDQDGSASGFGAPTDLNTLDNTCSANVPPLSVLNGYDDWPNLQFDFRLAPDYDDGAPRRTVSTTPELTPAQVIAAGKSVDFDGDGIPNADDNCPAVFNPDQTDSLGNGIGDACRPGAPADTTPPVTTVSVTPPPNAAGWNNSDVTVTFSAADQAGGSGQKEIVYTATGALNTSLTVPGGAASLLIAAEGATTITYFSRDKAGNAEATHSFVIRLDKTPPAISGSRNPQPNANGWNNANVTVTFLCSDALSGLAAGSPPPAVMIATEGAGQTATGTCTDMAGNSASVTVGNINIDKTPPTLACSAAPNVLWPPDNKLVAVNTSVAVNDPLSGPDGFQLLSVISSEPGSGAGDIAGWLVGAPSTSGQLRATRLGAGQGRIYTLSYSGKDKAGNAAVCAPSVLVQHDQR